MHPSPLTFPPHTVSRLRPDAVSSHGLLIAILTVLLTLAVVPSTPGVSWAGKSTRKADPKSAGLPLGVVASVNGVPIRQVRLDSIVDQMIHSRPQGAATITADQRLDLRKSVLRTLIGREFLLQRARGEGYAASGAEVDESLAGIQENFFGGSEEKFQAQLRKDEMTLAELRENLKESIILSKLKRKVYDGTSAVPEEIRKTYESHKSEFVKPESVRARNIYIKSDGEGTPEQERALRARIDAARAESMKGDFAAAAAKYSEGTNASKGGEMGEITRGTPLMQDMIDILFKTPPGQISEPFRNKIGWHVVKVEGRTPAHQLTHDEATEPISRASRIQKTEKEMATMASRLWREGKVESRIEVSPEDPSTGYSPSPIGR